MRYKCGYCFNEYTSSKDSGKGYVWYTYETEKEGCYLCNSEKANAISETCWQTHNSGFDAIEFMNEFDVEFKVLGWFKEGNHETH